MATDTVRQLAVLQALFPDGTDGDISPKWGVLRDFLVSALPTGRSATKVVASADASALRKAQADYAGGGPDINAAIAAAGAGKVVLTEGAFTTVNAVTPIANVSLAGQGQLATAIKCETAGINVIQVHGTGPGDMLTGITLRDFRVYTAAAVASRGLSVKYAKTNMFDNLDIRDFASHGLRIQGSYDNRYRNIYMSGCGHVANAEAALSLENLADQNVNNENFLQVFMEPYTYRALNIGADVGAQIAHFNRFTACKFHGDTTQTGPAIVVAGDMNVFKSLELSKTGAAATAMHLTGDAVGNEIMGLVVGNTVGIVLLIDGDYNIIDVFHCAAEAVTAADIYGAGNQLSNLTLLGMTGEFLTVRGNNNRLTGVGLQGGSETGITVSGHYNKLSDVTMDSVPKSGVILSGNQNELHGVSPFWVAGTSGEACEVSGDGNKIFGGTFNGPNAETIVFAAGADNNRVFGAQVGKAIVDGGSGNRVENVVGYTTENSGTSTGTGAQQTIAHGLGAAPTRVYLSTIEDAANAYQSAPADATNIYLTAVSGKDYVWKAEVV